MPPRRRRPGARLPGRAKRVFARTLERVDELVALHPTLHGTQGRPRQAVADVLRGALVLSLAALDALVVDTLLEAIPILAKKRDALGPTVAKWVDENPKKLVDCFSAADPSQALADLCGDEIGRLTFQRAAAIEGILRDVALCPSPWAKAAAELTAGGATWTDEDVVKRLDEYVERRNRIVHGGDLTGTGTTRAIQLPYVTSALALIRAVGNAVDSVARERVATV